MIMIGWWWLIEWLLLGLWRVDTLMIQSIIIQNHQTALFSSSYPCSYCSVVKLLPRGPGCSISITNPQLLSAILSLMTLRNLYIPLLSIINLCGRSSTRWSCRIFLWLAIFFCGACVCWRHFLALLLFSSSVWLKNSCRWLNICVCLSLGLRLLTSRECKCFLLGAIREIYWSIKHHL